MEWRSGLAEIRIVPPPGMTDIERIYEQLDENSLDALTVHSDHPVPGDILNDLHD